MKKWILVVVVVGLLGWAVYDFVLSDSDTAEETTTEEKAAEEVGIEVGDTAPNFTLETLEGEEVKLSDYRGQKVLLNFWATWCPPCRAEMPDMQKYHEEDAGDEVVILGVNLTSQENSMTGIEDFLDEYDISFIILSDKTETTAHIYDAFSLPTSYLINKDGSIHDIAVGPLNYELMIEKLDEMD